MAKPLGRIKKVHKVQNHPRRIRETCMSKVLDVEDKSDDDASRSYSDANAGSDRTNLRPLSCRVHIEMPNVRAQPQPPERDVAEAHDAIILITIKMPRVAADGCC